jgi:membrane-associated phospholipid phosphatase
MTPELLIRLLADLAVVPVVLLGAYALIFKIRKGNHFQAYARILLAGLTAYMLAKFIGFIYQPSELRPFELLGVEAGASFLDNPGFPSDHVLFVAAITLAVWFETRQKLITAILVVLVGIVGLGRVLALVHSPLDVIGGLVIAAIGALWYVQKPRSLKAPHKRRSSAK